MRPARVWLLPAVLLSLLLSFSVVATQADRGVPGRFGGRPGGVAVVLASTGGVVQAGVEPRSATGVPVVRGHDVPCGAAAGPLWSDGAVGVTAVNRTAGVLATVYAVLDA